MKKIVLLMLIIISQNVLVAQTNTQLKVTELTFLVDITDSDLFSQIKADFEQNLSAFFQATELGKIKEQEKFTLSVAPISATGEFVLKSTSIAIPRKGLALQEVRRLSNPQPLMVMLKQQLAVFDSIKVANNERSYIIDIVLKSIAQANESAERNVIVMCTDGLEYSPVCNMYKKIPTTNQETEQVLKSIDPTTLNRAKQRIQSGCDPEIVIVIKQKTGSRNGSDLKQFWSSFLNKIGITTVVFIDNFTQNPQI
jgi:hypothetical protein